MMESEHDTAALSDISFDSNVSGPHEEKVSLTSYVLYSIFVHRQRLSSSQIGKEGCRVALEEAVFVLL